MTRAPLAGLRVLTVSQFGAGPFGTQVLADLGADVIKIEDPTVGGDIARYVPPFRDGRDSLYFQSFNRGKKSITLDLRRPDAAGVLHDRVRVSHAVYNHLRGDLPEKLGLTYATLGADEIVVVDQSGRTIAKLGDFGGLDHEGAPIGLLFPASLVFSGAFVDVTNLAIDLRLFGAANATGDSPWTADVKVHTISRIPAFIPPARGLPRP